MANNARREIELALNITTANAQALGKLRDDVKELAKEGGDAAPEFKRLADELGALEAQAKQLQALDVLTKDLESASTKMTEVGASAKTLGDELKFLKGITEQAGAAQRAAKADYEAARAEVKAIDQKINLLNKEKGKQQEIDELRLKRKTAMEGVRTAEQAGAKGNLDMQEQLAESARKYEALRQDAAAPERAYADYLAGRPQAHDLALLPPQHQVAAARLLQGTAVTAADAATLASISDPLARLVAAGVWLRAGQGHPAVMALAVDTASARGWSRPLLAWLQVQARHAELGGDVAGAQRLRRRMALVLSAGKLAPQDSVELGTHQNK